MVLSPWVRSVRVAAWASLAANVVLVVTGGLVRLTASGLGCPTWPKCIDGDFTPRHELGVHQAIEFGNRMLTYVLLAVAVWTVVVAWRTVHRRLAVVILCGIPAQAVLGGISVLTDLNPWVVSAHLIASMAIICLCVWLLVAAVPAPAPERDPAAGSPSPLRGSDRGVGSVSAAGTAATVMHVVGRLTFVAGALVIYAGTAVTGAGPHAGDARAKRNGLPINGAAQLHADLVFLFIGLTVGLLCLAYALGRVDRRPFWALLGVELAQGVVGYVQYFSHVPVPWVAVHMLGAALTASAMTWALLASRRP